MIGLSRYRYSLYYFRSTIIIIIILLSSFSAILSIAQDATVTVNVKTLDGTGHPNIEVRLDDDPVHYQAFTDNQGQAILNGVLTPVEAVQDNMIVRDYKLEWGNPNPVKDSSSLFKFRYQIPQQVKGSVPIRLIIYDINGEKVQEILNDEQTPGKYEATWDGMTDRGYPAAAGIYIYQLWTPHTHMEKKIALLTQMGGSYAGTLVKRIGNAEQTNKIASRDYQLSLFDDVEQRFDNQSGPVTIAGDTTIDLTVLERFNWNGPPLIVRNPTDTFGVAFDWAQFGTALQDLLNDGTHYIIVRTDPDSLYFTPINQNKFGSFPLDLLALGQFSTPREVSQPVLLVIAEDDSLYGKVTTPNGITLENVDVAAYDGQFNLFGNDITDGDGRYRIDSLTAGIYNIIFTDLINNRTNKDTVFNVIIPSKLDKIQQEFFQYFGPLEINGQESDTIWVQHADYSYPGFGLNHLEVDNTADWEHVITEDDSSGYRTIIQNFNGTLPLIIRAVSNGGTEKIVSTPVNLEDMVTWQGQFVDDMLYKKLLGIIEPGAGLKGKINVNNTTYNTDDFGNFSIRIPAGSTYTVMARGIDDLMQPTTYIHTSQEDGTDQTNLILHAMPYWPLLQMGLLPPDGYDFAWEANIAPGSGANYPGLKIPNWITGENGIYQYNHFDQDTMSIDEMNYLFSVIADSFNVRTQIDLPIILHFLPDSANINTNTGENFWFKWANGPAGGISSLDADQNGIWDRHVIFIRAGTPQWLHAILQEGASSIYGPWQVFNPNLGQKTIIHETSNSGYITLADDWLIRLIENYEPLDDIDDILGF